MNDLNEENRSQTSSEEMTEIKGEDMNLQGEEVTGFYHGAYGQQNAGRPYTGGYYNPQYGQGASYNGYQAPFGMYNGGSGYGANNGVSYIEKPYKRPRKGGKFVKKALKVVAAAVIFGIVAGGTFIGVNKLYYVIDPAAAEKSTVVVGNIEGASGAGGENANSVTLASTATADNIVNGTTDVSAIVESAMPSVVIINSKFTTTSFFGSYESGGTGSGIIIDKTDKELVIATNNHVVKDATDLEVIFIDGETYKAQIKGTEPDADLAVIAIDLADIKAETLEQIKVATLSKDEVKVGQMAIAIGNALGYGQTTTVGYISAVDREINVDADTKLTLLQTDAAINAGNSGGALLNIKGEVIGINNAKLVSDAVEGVGFAIPISRAVSILDELKEREILNENEKGYLGITISNVTEEIAKEYNWPVGVYIQSVTEDYAAAKAGLLPGDIIVGVNEKETLTMDVFKKYINSFRVGTTVTVHVKRLVDGEFKDVDCVAELMKNPELDKEVKEPVITEAPKTEDEAPSDGAYGEPGEDDESHYYYDGDISTLPDEIQDFLENWGFFNP